MKKRAFRSRTFLTSLLVPAIAVIIPALVLGAFMSSSLFIRQWKDEHQSTVAANLQRSGNRLVSLLSQAARNMSQLKDDTSVENYIMGDFGYSPQRVQAHQELLLVLDQFLASHEDYGDVILLIEAQDVVGSSSRWHYHSVSVTDEELMRNIQHTQSLSVRWHNICQRSDFLSDIADISLFDGSEWLLYGTRKYTYSYSNGLPRANAIVLMTIRHSALLNCFSQLADHFATVSVLDAGGTVLSSTDSQLISTKAAFFEQLRSDQTQTTFVSDENLRVFWHYIPELDWYLVRSLPQERFEAQYVPVMKISILWGAMSIAAISLFFPLILHRRCKPLSKLSRALRRVSTGDLEVRLQPPPHAAEEINQILDTFNEMIDNLNMLMDQRERDEQEKLLLEVRNLQTQLSPHFIYNSLTAIRWQAIQEGAPLAEEMLLQLVRLLRPVYSSWQTEWSLREELTYTRDYIQLMRLRQQQDILITFHTEEVDEAAMVPRFILQPLLENCFLHGIASNRPFSIALTAKYSTNGIVLKVIDNGRGIPEDVLSSIHQALDAVSRGEETEHFIGICNVHRRLMLYFDTESGLEIESALSEGTSITVHLGVRGQRSTQELNVLQEKKG